MRHKYYFSVAAMFTNESWTLKEWVEHYKLQGADHIYLVDDFSDDDDPYTVSSPEHVLSKL